MSDPDSSTYAYADASTHVADNQQRSGWRFFSIGVVNANKKLSKDTIEVTPIEHTSLVHGELTDFKEDLEITSQDYQGNEWSEKLTTTTGIMARWIPIGQTHRLTSPDVRRGDLVLLYQYGDSDEYWWEEFRRNDKKMVRRLETLVWGISNNSEENKEDDYDSMYTWEVSTHRKILQVHTAKNDKEPFEYWIQLDTKTGRLVIKDDDDNYIEFDSSKRFIKIHNKDKSYVELDKQIITIHSLDKVIINTKHFEVNAKETIKENTKAYTIKANSSYKLTTQSYKATSSSWETVVPTAKFSQTVTTGANLHVGGSQTTVGSSDNHHSH